MAEVMTNVFDECQDLRNAGQDEYAHDQSNAFANFERVASFLDIPREKVLLVYAIKHLDGICSYVDGHQSQREDVRGRINDLCVYMTLLRGMVDENEGELPDS